MALTEAVVGDAGSSSTSLGSPGPASSRAGSSGAAATDLQDAGASTARPAEFVTLTRRRVYILPTRQGIAFGGILVVMLLGAANYDNGLGYALVFLLSSVSLVSLVHTYRNLAGLKVSLHAGMRCFAGQNAGFQLIVDNRGGALRPGVVVRLQFAGIALSDPAATAPKSSSWPTASAFNKWLPTWMRKPEPERLSESMAYVDIKPDALQSIDLGVHTSHRGWLEVSRIIVATRYPFGLFRGWSVPAAQTRSLVYPKPGGRQSLPLGGGGGLIDYGVEADGQDDFSGLRDYSSGDSPRRIHWKALARGQGLLVKQFSGGAPAEVELDWGQTVGPTEARISQLAQWVVDASAAGQRFCLKLEGQTLGPDAGNVHRERALAALALHRLPEGSGPVDTRSQGNWTGGV